MAAFSFRRPSFASDNYVLLHTAEFRFKQSLFALDRCTVVEKSHESRCKYWASNLAIHSFACSAYSFACSAYLLHTTCSLSHSFVCSLAHSLPSSLESELRLKTTWFCPTVRCVLLSGAAFRFRQPHLTSDGRDCLGITTQTKVYCIVH